VKEKPKAGVFQGSLVSLNVVNCILDGLEKTIKSVYKSFKATKYKRSEEDIVVILKYKKDFKKIKKNCTDSIFFFTFC